MKTKVVRYHQHGKPSEVLRVEEEELRPLGDHDVLVKMVAAPINPSDINMIEGTYARLPPLPAVCGWEGVGIVQSIGQKVTKVKIGQQVKPPNDIGTWREAFIAKDDELFVIEKNIPSDQAAMITVNPPTALRLLDSFVQLKPGDWIIQNAANSAVGRMVIQIAKAKGIRTINIVRRKELIDDLKNIGADIVVTDEVDLRKNVPEWTSNSPVLLGLNAVGGESAVNIAKSLSFGGTHVTYGGMSKQPFRIPTGLLIFKDLRVRGFWLTAWNKDAGRDQVNKTLAEVVGLIAKKQIHTPVEESYKLDEAIEAVAHAMQGSRNGKVLFCMSKDKTTR